METSFIDLCGSRTSAGFVFVVYFQSPFIIFIMYKVNGKAIPLQAWTDPEGSRKQRLPDFKIIGT